MPNFRKDMIACWHLGFGVREINHIRQEGEKAGRKEKISSPARYC
jgi:hypothetical protein